MAMNGADMFGGLLSGDGSSGLGGFDLMGILDLLRQLYAARQPANGMNTASASSGDSGGQAGQLPHMPGGGPGQPLQGGAFSNGRGDTFDAAGNPLTFAGVTSPQMTMPTDRTALIQSLARSSQPDQYGNVPYNGPTPGMAHITAIPDFSKPPQPGNMVDPRNWDPTQWVNHPEWHNEEVWRAYEQSQGAFNNRGPYTDPSGGSLLPFQKQPLPPASSWGYNPATKMWGYQGVAAPNLSQPGQYANLWSSLGFHNKADWRTAGRPASLPQGTPLYTGVGGPYHAPAAGSGTMGIGLPSVGSAPAWQQQNFADKAAWKQAGRPGL